MNQLFTFVTLMVLLTGCATSQSKPATLISRQSSDQPIPFYGITRVPVDVHVAWSPPDDFSPAGFNVYYGVDPDLENSTMVPVGTTTNTVVTSLAGGTQYYFAVTDFDWFGEESSLSEIVPYTTPLKLDVTFAFDTIVTNITLQESADLKHWSTLDATSTNGVYRIVPRVGIPMEFFRAIGQSTGAL